MNFKSNGIPLTKQRNEKIEITRTCKQKRVQLAKLLRRAINASCRRFAHQHACEPRASRLSKSPSQPSTHHLQIEQIKEDEAAFRRLVKCLRIKQNKGQTKTSQQSCEHMTNENKRQRDQAEIEHIPIEIRSITRSIRNECMRVKKFENAEG